MAGPGGGSRGGGGFSGGSRGGSFGGGTRGGGGFHGGGFGGHRPPPGGGMHRPSHGGGFYGGGWHRRPRHYGGGGGCLNGICSLIFVPIVLTIFAVTFLFSSIQGKLTVPSDSGVVGYDENVFQDYADTQYNAEFGRSAAYEDNILLVFLTEDEAYYDYYYIAWVGDHIATDINYMFGNEETELGQAIADSVNVTSYKYSLDANLAQVVEALEKQIVSQGLASSFTCDEDHTQVKSHLTNKTSLDLTEDTVNAALQRFTDATGIPIVIVVDDIVDVFKTDMPVRSASAVSVFTIVIAIALVVLAVWLIVRSIRKRNEKDDDSNERTYTGPELD